MKRKFRFDIVNISLIFQIAKRLEEIEKQVNQLNATLRRLKMIPQAAKNAQNSEFQVTFDSRNPELCYESVKNIVKVMVKHRIT